MPIYFCLSYLLGSWIWIVHFLLVRSRESFTFYWFAWSSFASALTRDRPTWWCHICRRTKVHNFGIEFWGMLIISYFLFAMASPCCKSWILRLAFGVWRLAFASKRCRAWNNKSTHQPSKPSGALLLEGSPILLENTYPSRRFWV